MSEVGYIFPDDAAKQVVEVGNAIKQTDTALLKYTEDANKLIALLKQQNISFEQLQQVQEKTKKTVVELDAVGKTLIQSEEKLKQVSDKRTESIIKNRIETQKATKDIQAKIRVQQAEKGSIEQLSAVNSILEKRLKAVNLTTEDGIKKANLLRSAIDKNNVKIKENSSALGAQRINIGNYASALDGLPGSLGRAASGAMALGKQLWALVANPIGAVIAAITIALTGLFKIFTSTDEGATFFASTLKAIGNVTDILIDRLMSFVKLLGSIATFDFKGIKENGQAAFGGLASSIRDAAKAGWEYEQQMDSISDRESASLVKQAQLRKEIEELTQASKNRMLGTKEQIRLAELATAKAKELNDLENIFEKERTIAARNNLASKIQIDNMSIENRRKLLDEWLLIDDKQLNSAIENNKQFADFYNKNEDEIKNLQKLKAADIENDTKLLTSTRRLNTSLFGFKKQLFDEEKREREERAKKEKEFEDAYLEGQQKTAEEDLRIWAEQINKKYKLGLKQIEIEKAINDTILSLSKEGSDKELEIADKELDAQLKKIDEIKQAEIKAEEEKEKAKKEARKQAFDDAVNLGNTLFDLRSANLQREFEMAEGNEQKQKEISAKMAKNERNQALFNVAINTAEAVVKSIAGSPLTFGLPFSAFALATGALQAAAILAQPIPKFAKGTDYAPNEFIAGEKGRELVRTQSGDLLMADKATHFKGNRFKGATVYTNRETEQIINQSGKGNNFVFDTSELRDEMRAVKKAILNKPVLITDKSGKITGRQSNNYREMYLNRMQNGR